MSVAGIILAAGASRRMGRQKLLLPYGGKTVVGHIVAQLLAGGLPEVIAVVGADGAAVAKAIGDDRVRLVTNPVPDGDMLSSVRCGLRAVGADCQAVLVALGDQPAITSALVGRMLDTWRAGGRGIVVPVFGGKRGHPLLVSLRYRDEVLAQFDGLGLRGLLSAHADDVMELAADAAVLSDMDYPEDYRRELRRLIGPADGGQE